MPDILAFWLAPAETVTLSLAVVLAFLVTAIGVRTWKQSRVTPEERERRRRASLVARGKMGDASLVEIRDNLIFYSYDVRGVGYTASQDVSALRTFLPQDFAVGIGPIYVKYDPRNPANSVVLSEEWSGLGANFLSN